MGGFSRHWGPHDAAAARWRLNNIVVPAVALVGATVTVAPSRVFAEALRLSELEGMRAVYWPQGRAHLMGPIVDWSRANRGRALPKMMASLAAQRIVKGWGLGEFYPLTERQQSNDPHRNSPKRKAAAL